ncbi:5'-nucleotidase C-terminal domain-containing protein [Heyndrickxia sp. NPDC080065]|uniref:5'-nucleotidase C-terminal domain-containing protein n=1 Tax=Heyndrickxia sp. NPDC080065 TaxID=3390568 RepID=UPI003D0533E8
MNFKKKGLNVAKVVLSTAVATSVIAAASQAEAATKPTTAKLAKNAEKLVKNAEKKAAELKKQITYESRAKLFPKDKLGLPSMKLYKETEAALKKAKKEVNKLNGKSKKTLLSRLSSKVETPYKNATAYIKVVNAAKELDKTNKKLETALNKGNIDSSIIKIHTKFSADIKKFSKSISQLKGTGTKQAFTKAYLNKFTKTDKALSYVIAVQKDFTELNKLIANDEDKKAEALIEKIKKKLIDGKKLGYIKGTLAKKFDGDLNKAINDLKNGKETFKLSIMHSNDTHAHLDDIAKKVTAVKEIRASKPHSLLIDAGDVFSGTLYFNEFKGQADLEFMNLMKYDVMTVGNHEFDLGSSPEGHQALADFIKGAHFPIVSSNVDYSKDDKLKGLFSDLISSKPEEGKIYNGIIKEIDGEKVGFFGLTTEETKDISSPGKVEFKNYIEEAKKAVKAFEKQGVNKIIAITHIGFDDNPDYDNDLLLASNVDGIDVIIGGHSHTKLEEPVVINKDKNGKKKDPTVIVQAYQYNDYLGTLDVEFDKKGRVIGQSGHLITIADKAEDLEAAEMLKPYAAKISEVRNTPTGATAVKALENPRDGGILTNPSVRKNETELGNLITDGMLAKAKEYNKDTVIAFQNGGGIRSDIKQGDISLGDVLTVLPFGNTLATMTLKGSEIIEALEHSVSQAPNENGGFLHVSGLKFTYDSSKPAGQRVQKVEVKGDDGSYSDLQLTSNYVVATNAFTAKGGDGFTVFQKAYEEGRVTDLGLSDWENLRDYVQQLKTVNPVIEGRIVDIAGK